MRDLSDSDRDAMYPDPVLRLARAELTRLLSAKCHRDEDESTQLVQFLMGAIPNDEPLPIASYNLSILG